MTKEQRSELDATIMCFADNFVRLSELFEDVQDEIDIAEAYPFEKSFNEYISPVFEWTDSIQGQLAKEWVEGKKREFALKELKAFVEYSYDAQNITLDTRADLRRALETLAEGK